MQKRVNFIPVVMWRNLSMRIIVEVRRTEIKDAFRSCMDREFFLFFFFTSELNYICPGNHLSSIYVDPGIARESNH